MHELPVFFSLSVLSQLTFTITVTLLAWRSRRGHRMIWLVAACCLPILLNGSMSMLAQTYSVRAAMRWAAGGALCLMLLSILTLYVASRRHIMEQEAYFDSLTGLHSRSAMKTIAAREVVVAKDTHAPLALLLIEVDQFKQFNTALGEDVCNRVLRAIGGVLQTVGSAKDMVARLRSAEFGVLLPACSAKEANRIAEGLRDTIQSLQFQADGRVVSFTVSVGGGMLRASDTSWAQMLSRADVALLCSKQGGRNRVVMDAGSAQRPASQGSLSMPAFGQTATVAAGS